MRRPQCDESRRGQGRAGFTLVELLVVVAIIGLIISLILVAAADGVRRAEERATQALITKLEVGINDRIDALLNSRGPVNQTHRYLAAITYANSSIGSGYYPVDTVPSLGGGTASKNSGSVERRAQVIAQYDLLRAEMPDVFFVNAGASGGAAFAASYPLNFAGAPYPPGTTSYSNYYLPLGTFSPGLPLDSNLNLTPNVLGLATTSPATFVPPPTGIFGASFSAAGGLYKTLYAAAAADTIANSPSAVINTNPALDGADNNGDGLIDDMGEVQCSSSGVTSSFQSAVTARLQKHTHKTARSEMLYAILVEGLGPLGSVFTSDEFTQREVQDTDGDGLPEFVDAWGEPLLFFRWPIYYGAKTEATIDKLGLPSSAVAGPSDSQKGSDPYTGYPDTRQLDPLDANQLLVSPGWWSLSGNPGLPTSKTSIAGFPPTFTAPDGSSPDGSTYFNQSQQALGFMHYFGSLVDPLLSSAAGSGWDRTGGYNRRAYFTKFLVLSGGPDKQPGVGQFARDYTGETADGSGSPVAFPNSSLSIENNTKLLLMIENQASQTDPNLANRAGHFYEVPNGYSSSASGFSTTPTGTTLYLQSNAGLDDISNHNNSAPSTGVR